MILLLCINITIVQGERAITFSTGVEEEGCLEWAHGQNPLRDKTTEMDESWKQQIMQKYFSYYH